MEVIPHKLGNLRTVIVEGIPWFCGKDVAAALAYTKSRNAIARHVNEKQKCVYQTLRECFEGGPVSGPSSDLQPHAVFINEAGVYSLVMGSRLPEAVAFKDWVCEEVLPTIRKYGTYTWWKDVRNERQLHYELCDFARKAYPKVRISPGLGEMQDSREKRIECWSKGYQKGQPDLIVHQRSGNFSGLVIELKSPRGTGIVSPEQQQWLDDMACAGYRVLLSSSLEESIRHLNAFMQNARVCCRHCGSSFASERTLQRHSEKYHRAFI